jgi:hypothetical protein
VALSPQRHAAEEFKAASLDDRGREPAPFWRISGLVVPSPRWGQIANRHAEETRADWRDPWRILITITPLADEALVTGWAARRACYYSHKYLGSYIHYLKTPVK